jgi:hypothetical protein
MPMSSFFFLKMYLTIDSFFDIFIGWLIVPCRRKKGLTKVVVVDIIKLHHAL